VLVLVACICIQAVVNSDEFRSMHKKTVERTMKLVADFHRIRALKNPTDRQLLDSCANYVDANNDPDYSVAFTPSTEAQCSAYFGAEEGYGNTYVCPTTSTTTNLPAGSCCEDTSQCAVGLECDYSNRVCSDTCQDDSDCTSGITCDGVSTNLPNCNYCDDYGTNCDGYAFCSLCPAYVGAVSAGIMSTAGCTGLAAPVSDATLNDICAAQTLCIDPYITLLSAIVNNSCIPEWCGMENEVNQIKWGFDYLCPANEYGLRCYYAAVQGTTCATYAESGCCFASYRDYFAAMGDTTTVASFDSIISACSFSDVGCDGSLPVTVCPALNAGAPENGGIGTCNKARSPPDSCIYSCNDGFTPKSQYANYRGCQADGTWTTSTAECVASGVERIGVAALSIALPLLSLLYSL